MKQYYNLLNSPTLIQELTNLYKSANSRTILQIASLSNEFQEQEINSSHCNNLYW
jgi:hypothetical protein